MATYYVRLDGNDANSGLGPAANQAWATLDKALGATGITSGDTVYIAPGDYRRGSTLFVNGTYSSMVYIKGDPTCSQFTGITPGRILITSRNTNDIGSSNAINPVIDLNSRSFMTWENFIFEQASLQRAIFHARTGTDLSFIKCIFVLGGQQQIRAFDVTYAPMVTRNILFSRCGVFGFGGESFWTDQQTGTVTANYTYNFTIDRCWGLSATISNPSNMTYGPQGIYMVNSYGAYSLQNVRGNIVLRNSIFYGGNPYAQGASGTGIIENCSFNSPNNFNYSYANNIDDVYNLPFASDMPSRLFQYTGSHDYPLQFNYSYYKNSGTLTGTIIPTLAGLPGYSATGTPLTDIYGNPWDGNGTPHIGVFNNYSTTSSIGLYLPLERQVESFTVSPNTTNRTELIYLGAKGLTHTTPSLSASYVRAGAIRTAITLVSQTPNGSWTSGGFCEIDSTNMPGIYRIDVPNAVFVAGAESAMLQFTGTNQTNGAVVHYNMAKVQFDLSQNVPLTNTAHSIGDALNAARAQGFGKWQIVGNTMNIYAEDGITLVKSFNLDSGSYPTQRM
jgi:hypothetical protein